jgi:hypothetical protein
MIAGVGAADSPSEEGKNSIVSLGDSGKSPMDWSEARSNMVEVFEFCLFNMGIMASPERDIKLDVVEPARVGLGICCDCWGWTPIGSNDDDLPDRFDALLALFPLLRLWRSG